MSPIIYSLSTSTVHDLSISSSLFRLTSVSAIALRFPTIVSLSPLVWVLGVIQKICHWGISVID